MKNLTFLISIVCLCFCTKAQNVIAVEHGSSTSFYTRLDTALLYAQNGDNVYLPGGFITTYTTPLIINKTLNIYGVGYNADSSPVVGNTVFLSNIEIAYATNGGSISGVSFGSITIHDAVSNYKISRCNISQLIIGSELSNYPASKITISECIISSNIWAQTTSTNWPNNVFISNCFIGNSNISSPIGAGQYPNNFPCNGLICRNNIFYANSSCSQYSGAPFLFSISNSLFENCCFFDLGSGCSGNGNTGLNTYKNCLFTMGSSYIQTQSNSNFVYNCIFSQNKDSIFIDHKGTTFDIHNNYQLRTNSLGKNAGTDGQDIGLYGGNYPWKDGGIPVTPHIQYRKVKGTTNNDGTLPVQIKVKAQDN